MATKVEKSVVVNVPVDTVYNQWTQFEEFPHFMGGISEIRQLDDTTLLWVADIGGIKRQWQAVILEQVPNEKVAWAATEGATNAGAVYFSPAGGPSQTNVRLEMEYEPEGVAETLADKVGLVTRRVEADLENFKSFIEDAGYASGAWRGAVAGAGTTPGVESAASSRGDSGKAGISGKAVAAAIAGAAAATAGLAALLKSRAGGKGKGAEQVEHHEVVVVDTNIPAADTLADEVVDESYPAVPDDPIAGRPGSGDRL